MRRTATRRGRGCGPGLVALVAAALAGPALAAAGGSHGPQPVTGLHGIWKMCYEPGLEGIVEIDSGYLVLLPDGRFYEVGQSCCGDPPSWELAPYSADEEGVVLHDRRHDGTPFERPLRHRRGARAVFFDDPRGEPREVEALVAGEDLNYSWCRAYPGPESRPGAEPPAGP